MLSADTELNVATMRSVLGSGHSRVPVHRPGNRHAPCLPVFLQPLLLCTLSRLRSEPQRLEEHAIMDLAYLAIDVCFWRDYQCLSPILAPRNKQIGSNLRGEEINKGSACGVQARCFGADHSEGAGIVGSGGGYARQRCQDAAAAHAARRHRHVRTSLPPYTANLA